MSPSRAVLADDHPLVDVVARGDEHFGPLLQFAQGERDDLARLLRDEHAVGTLGDVALHRLVRLVAVMDDRLAARGVEQPGPQADQSAGGNREFEMRHARLAGHHFEDLAAAHADLLHHLAHVGGGDVDHEDFKRLVPLRRRSSCG